MSGFQDDSQASSAQRTLRLAELLLTQPNGLTPQELVAELEISRSTLFVLLNTLKQLGYVEQSEKRGRYRAGARLHAWRGAGGPHTAELTQAFYQEADRQAVSETLALAAPAALGATVLAQVEGSQTVRAVLGSGQTAATLPAAAQLFTPQPPPEVRANGFALAAHGDTLELALPVCRDGSHPEAAVLLCAPAFRWESARLLQTFLPMLRAMAARLSYRLGAGFYAPFQGAEQRAIGPATALSPDEIAAFLSGPWTARLACIRPDGKPHVIPVWQEWDGSAFTVITWQGSQWAGYLRHNPNVSLTVDEPWPPLRRITCRGIAAPVSQSEMLPAVAARMTRRYLGQPGMGLAGQVEGAFRITPDALRGVKGLA